MKIVFVGDKPSSKNTWNDVPFIGTKSHNVLLKWIAYMQIHDFRLMNSHMPDYINYIRDLWLKEHKVIALGNLASKRLDNAGIFHYKLPHPSPRNRQLNDQGFVL